MSLLRMDQRWIDYLVEDRPGEKSQRPNQQQGGWTGDSSLLLLLLRQVQSHKSRAYRTRTVTMGSYL
jgi:hypothetical protein